MNISNLEILLAKSKCLLLQTSIAESTISVFKGMYKSPWLKNVEEVARDQGGRFVSKTSKPVSDSKVIKSTLPSVEDVKKAGINPIVNSDGSGTSLFHTTEINGKKYFLKEVQKTRTIKTSRRSWDVHSPFGAEREEIGGDVARLMGLEEHIIPTKKIEIEGKKYTIAPFTQGEPFWDIHPYDIPIDKKVKLIEDKLKSNTKKAVLFDFLMDNRDRHAGNTYISKDGSLKLIDHEFILSKRENSVSTPPLKGVMRTYVQGMKQVGTPVKFNETELENTIAQRSEIINIIKKHLPPQEAENAISVLNERMDFLQKMINTGDMDAYSMTLTKQEIDVMDALAKRRAKIAQPGESTRSLSYQANTKTKTKTYRSATAPSQTETM